MKNQHEHFSRVVVLSLIAGVGGAAGFAARTQDAKTASATSRSDKDKSEQSPFFCNVKALNGAEWDRLKQLQHKLADARVETLETPEGYGFRLAKGKIALSEVTEWISLEGRCCPFFDFKIEQQRDGGSLWLKVEGADGVKQFLRSEFHILKVE